VKILEITDIRVKKILTENSAESKMKAVVSVTFDDAFVIHDIKIIEGQDKLFTAMPSRKTQDGEFKDIAHPINRETRLKLEEAILAEYRNALEQSTVE
jgi:stage V sporulation protein G